MLTFARARADSVRLLSLVVRVLVAIVLAASGAWGDELRADAGAAVGALPTQLEELARWVDGRRAARCVEACFVLTSLRVVGAVGKPLDFELEGGVLTDGPFAVPLFGPPSRVRIEQAFEGKKPAAIGFVGDRYFLFTDARHFVLRGRMTLERDLMLAIAGPLNVFDAELSSGRIAEGAHLAGLLGTTLHFQAGDARPPSEPSVFQLARAIRIGREIAFEYRLTLKSGAELGVVKLGLRYGERVLDVHGASAWRVEGTELLLSTAGREAELTVRGVLPKLGKFTPDERSAYEHWLVEGDGEHRLVIDTAARRVDASESPIARTQAAARLYLLTRAEHLDVTAQPLGSTAVLAAIVRTQQRTAVLSRRGDLVFDDTLSYENNGIDFLPFSPAGRPIFLANDGQPERLVNGGDEGEVLIGLRKGSHVARVQAIAQTKLERFAGVLRVPFGSQPLATSSAELTLGLPEAIFPVVAVGGDRPVWFVGAADAVAVLLGFLPGWILLPTRLRRVGAGVALGGLWFVSPGTFVVLIAGCAIGFAVWLLSRFLRGLQLASAGVIIVGAGALAIVLSLTTASMRSPERPPLREPSSTAVAAAATDAHNAKGGDKDESSAAIGGKTALLPGAIPVALPLPAYARAVTLRRELVTRERPFVPEVVYLTSWTVGALIALWGALTLAVVLVHRKELLGLVERARGRLVKPPEVARETAPKSPSAR